MEFGSKLNQINKKKVEDKVVEVTPEKTYEQEIAESPDVLYRLHKEGLLRDEDLENVKKNNPEQFAAFERMKDEEANSDMQVDDKPNTVMTSEETPSMFEKAKSYLKGAALGVTMLSSVASGFSQGNKNADKAPIKNETSGKDYTLELQKMNSEIADLETKVEHAKMNKEALEGGLQVKNTYFLNLVDHISPQLDKKEAKKLEAQKNYFINTVKPFMLTILKNSTIPSDPEELKKFKKMVYELTFKGKPDKFGVYTINPVTQEGEGIWGLAMDHAFVGSNMNFTNNDRAVLLSNLTQGTSLEDQTAPVSLPRFVDQNLEDLPIQNDRLSSTVKLDQDTESNKQQKDKTENYSRKEFDEQKNGFFEDVFKIAIEAQKERKGNEEIAMIQTKIKKVGTASYLAETKKDTTADSNETAQK